MKFHSKALVALAVLAAGGSALAESTYGYNPSGGARTATARLNVTVNIPKLVLLRVGSSGATVDTATLNGTFSGGIPGGVAVPADGSDQATGWSGVAPTMANASSTGVAVLAWTNGSGATLTGSLTTNFSTAGMDAAVTVSNSAAVNSGLNHPGANLTFGGTTNITRNELVGATWTYEMLGTAMLGFPSGSYTAQATYTATAP